jgi:uncharacterized UBP type Zn finger protein
MWGKHQHQDSKEFLTFLLNNIEEEIAEKVVFIPGRNIVETNLENNLEVTSEKSQFGLITY